MSSGCVPRTRLDLATRASQRERWSHSPNAVRKPRQWEFVVKAELYYFINLYIIMKKHTQERLIEMC